MCLVAIYATKVCKDDSSILPSSETSYSTSFPTYGTDTNLATSYSIPDPSTSQPLSPSHHIAHHTSRRGPQARADSSIPPNPDPSQAQSLISINHSHLPIRSLDARKRPYWSGWTLEYPSLFVDAKHDRILFLSMCTGYGHAVIVFTRLLTYNAGLSFQHSGYMTTRRDAVVMMYCTSCSTEYS